MAAAVLQNRLLANVEEALSAASPMLPPKIEEGVLSGLTEGATGATAGLAGPTAGIDGLIRGAFADAVGSGLLLVAAVAFLGALLAFGLFSAPPEPNADMETPKGSGRAEETPNKSSTVSAEDASETGETAA